MKRGFWLLVSLCFSLMLCLSAANVIAEEKQQLISEEYFYCLDEDGNAEIMAYIGHESTLELPVLIDGHEITSIGVSAFSNNEEITSVRIPEGISVIKDYAFTSCRNLSTVYFPESLKAFGANPFGGCLQLQNFDVAEENTEIFAKDGVLFSDGGKKLVCYSSAKQDTSYVVPDTVELIGANSFWVCSSLASIQLSSNLKEIGDLAFTGCGLTKIRIPDKLEVIGINPFNACESLLKIEISPDQPYFSVIDGVLFSKAEKSLICYPQTLQSNSYSIPYGIKSIQKNAFTGNTNLITIEIPETVDSISVNAFTNCENLKRVNLPDSLTTISGNPFSLCKNLSEVEISENQRNFEFIDGVLFEKDGYTLVCYLSSCQSEEYEIPDGVQIIGNNAFYMADNLKRVIVPESVEFIQDNAFMNCVNLEEIVFSQNLKEIGFRAFAYCVRLPEIIIPDKVDCIGNNAFQNCTSLTSIYIPETVKTIGVDAFSGCDYLTAIVERESYAKDYMAATGIDYTYPDADDWLNDMEENNSEETTSNQRGLEKENIRMAAQILGIQVENNQAEIKGKLEGVISFWNHTCSNKISTSKEQKVSLIKFIFDEFNADTYDDVKAGLGDAFGQFAYEGGDDNVTVTLWYDDYTDTVYELEYHPEVALYLCLAENSPVFANYINAS